MLEIKNISKSYEQILFNKINIKLPDNGLFFLIGESGCGKSTLLNIIAGLEKADEGNIYYQENEINDFDEFRKNEINFLFQDYGLIDSYDIKTNIYLSQILKRNQSDDEEIFETLKRLNINKQLNTIVKDLSGGEKQRIALAKIILNPKNIILCDEPSGSLDEDNTFILFNELKELSKKSLIIVVSHDIEIANKFADEIINIKKQKIKYLKNYEISNLKLDKEEYLNNIPINRHIKLCFKYLNIRKGRTFLSIFSLVFVMLLLLICLSCSFSIENTLTNQSMKYINYNNIQISLEETTSIKGTGFSFVKSLRPEKQKIEKLIDGYHYQLSYSLDYIFNKAIIKNDGEIISCQLKPIDFLYQTSYKKYASKLNNFSLNDVFINESLNKIIGNNLTIDINCSIESSNENNKKTYDNFLFNSSLNVISVVDEFNFLSVPTIYYSNQAAIKYLRNQTIENASRIYKRKISYYDRISYLSRDDEDISSYCYHLYLDDTDVEEVVSLLENRGYVISSYPLETRKQLTNVFSSIEKVMKIFVSISFLIVLVLEGIVLYSFVVERKKEIGLLSTIGVKKIDIQKMFCLKGIFLTMISGMFSLLLINPILNFINLIINKYFSINKLLSLPLIKFGNVFFGFEATFLFFSFLIGGVCGMVPSFFISKIKICDVLREE